MIWGRVADIINCAKFQLNLFRGFGVPGAENDHFPLTRGIALTTVLRTNVLHCDVNVNMLQSNIIFCDFCDFSCLMEVITLTVSNKPEGFLTLICAVLFPDLPLAAKF